MSYARLTCISASIPLAFALLVPAGCASEDETDPSTIGSEPVDTDVDTDLDPLAAGARVSCTAATAAAVCADDNPCTIDKCVERRCVHRVAPSTTVCDDGNACTVNDRCAAGPEGGPKAVCRGLPGGACGPPKPGVDLKTAGQYVVLAKSAISTVPNSAITGDLGLSPAAASNITGFALTAHGTFSTSTQVIGKLFGADYAPPTPANLTAAIGDMETAFTDAASRAPDFTETGAGNIGGLTLPAGVYKWGTGVTIPTDVVLAGKATDVWIFQIAGTLVMSSAKKVTLIGGAVSKNVFWQVSGLVDVGTSAHMEGVVLTKTAITLKTGSSINGRLYAQTAVSLQKATVTQPAP